MVRPSTPSFVCRRSVLFDGGIVTRLDSKYRRMVTIFTVGRVVSAKTTRSTMSARKGSAAPGLNLVMWLRSIFIVWDIPLEAYLISENLVCGFACASCFTDDASCNLFPALLNQFRHQSGPAGLMTGADASPVVPMKVFVEQYVVAPMRIALQTVRSAEHRACPLGILKKDVRQPA